MRRVGPVIFMSLLVLALTAVFTTAPIIQRSEPRAAAQTSAEEVEQRIDDLLAQIEELRGDRDDAINLVLTSGQRQRLQELEGEARQKRKKPAADDPGSKPQK